MKRLNKKSLNVNMLNTFRFNSFGTLGKQKNVSSDSGEAPSGYDLFKASDGDFKASDGEIYVKL